MIGRVPAAVSLVHPAPALAVVALSAALALIVSGQSGHADLTRVLLTVVAVAGSQIATGASNDWADRDRDRQVRRDKPIPSGRISPRAAIALALVGLALQLAASVTLGIATTLVGLAALASAVAYNLWLSRTPFSLLPYLVSFGLLPIWIALGVGAPVERVLPAVPLVAPFASAAHLANTLRDWDADAAGDSRSLAQLLGRPLSWALAVAMAVSVGVIAVVLFAVAGRVSPPSVVLGVVGLAAVVNGARSPVALWYGILVASVCWTAAWALATG
jgi:4-hydroxybenzoate polyprenyltransferase